MKSIRLQSRETRSRLAVPYPFHRDKLNSDDVRETVGGVLSRLLGRDISLVMHPAQ